MRRSGNGPPGRPACPDGAVHGPHVAMIDVTRDATHASCAPESSANPPGPRHGCGLGSEKLETPTCTDRPARCTSSRRAVVTRAGRRADRSGADHPWRHPRRVEWFRRIDGSHLGVAAQRRVDAQQVASVGTRRAVTTEDRRRRSRLERAGVERRTDLHGGHSGRRPGELDQSHVVAIAGMTGPERVDGPRPLRRLQAVPLTGPHEVVEARQDPTGASRRRQDHVRRDQRSAAVGEAEAPGEREVSRRRGDTADESFSRSNGGKQRRPCKRDRNRTAPERMCVHAQRA